MLSRYVVTQVKHNSYFVAGVALGLWVALATVPLDEGLEACSPLGGAGAGEEVAARLVSRAPPPAARARPVTRPRYYSTELAIRAPLLIAILSTEDQLDGRVKALNATLSEAGGAVRFFMAASGPAAAAPRPNVVGFTDSREMLRPFHALKYLADNYLDDYEVFVVAPDTAWLNARALQRTAKRLSAARRLYLGRAADGQPYCQLHAGILLSRATLAALQGSLDWCVRNSYSGQHHENLGRCVLHAAQVPCSSHVQGVDIWSVQVQGSLGSALTPQLADAVAAYPVHHPADMYTLHAYAARVELERGLSEQRALSSSLEHLARRHPPHFRNVTWPRGLRDDPGMTPPKPASRFDHWRWTWFNETHALTPDDHRNVAPLTGAHKEAVQLVLRRATSWARARWGGGAALREGAWRWTPATSLDYRLLLTVTQPDGATMVRGVLVSRILGGARIVSVPYVTESAKVHILMPVTSQLARDVAAFIRYYQENMLNKQHNTQLVVVSLLAEGETESPEVLEIKNKMSELGVAGRLTSAPWAGGGGGTEEGVLGALQHAALLSHALPKHALVLLTHPRAQFTDEFLNRVRMNTIAGVSWFVPAAFHRWAQYQHPAFRDPNTGGKPTTGTGRFATHYHTIAFYKADYDQAVSEWWSSPAWPRAASPVAAVLGAAGLRCVLAPDPALVVPPPPPPCRLLEPSGTEAERARCLRAHRAARFAELQLGARAALAGLLLQAHAA